MKTILKNIATVQTGIFAKQVSEGEIVYLQAKHFDENGNLHSTPFPDLKAGGITKKHLLILGDVLFASKGTKNFAALYQGKNQLAVASTSFFVIRLQKDYSKKILPEFLVWFINQPASQSFLKGRAIGTSIVSISKSVLDELEIAIPALQTQQAILKIAKLQNAEKILKEQIEMLREKQIQQQIINAINN